MKSVLISIKPKWCELIATGKKTVDVRKNEPKVGVPFKCYIYCTLPPREELFRHGSIVEYANELIRLQSGTIVYGYWMQLMFDQEKRPYSRDNFLCQKVIGEFVCDKVEYLGNVATDKWEYLAGGRHEELKRMVTERACLTEEEMLDYRGRFGWHISNLVIYDKPKELSDFNLKRPPQSWCYVEDGEEKIWNGLKQNTGIRAALNYVNQ